MQSESCDGLIGLDDMYRSPAVLARPAQRRPASLGRERGAGAISVSVTLRLAVLQARSPSGFSGRVPASMISLTLSQNVYGCYVRSFQIVCSHLVLSRAWTTTRFFR